MSTFAVYPLNRDYRSFYHSNSEWYEGVVELPIQRHDALHQLGDYFQLFEKVLEYQKSHNTAEEHWYCVPHNFKIHI